MIVIPERARKYIKDVLHARTTPHSIALGFAIGTLINILPVWGLNLLLGLLVVLAFSQVSKLALFAALLFWNPLTLLPVYYASHWIGQMLFGTMPVIRYQAAYLNELFTFARGFLVGDVIMALTISLASYFIVRSVAELYQRRAHAVKAIGRDPPCE